MADGDWLFTCKPRHELTLIGEITERKRGSLIQAGDISIPSPGLIAVHNYYGSREGRPNPDPTWALQIIPDCRIVKAESINLLAKAAIQRLENVDENGFKLSSLEGAARGSLAVHAFTLDTCRGVTKPALASRCDGIAAAVLKSLTKRYDAARKASKKAATTIAVAEPTNNGTIQGQEGSLQRRGEKWLLQLLLLDRNTLCVSLASCRESCNILHTWPNWQWPAGHAPCDVKEYMPSSAYRKLAEALYFMSILGAKNPKDPACVAEATAGSMPSIKSAVDLGACPGGWTALLLRIGCADITAVDKSPLDPCLFQNDGERREGKGNGDHKPQDGYSMAANQADYEKRGSLLGFKPAVRGKTLRFVQGDAFLWEPPPRNSKSIREPVHATDGEIDDDDFRVDLMVSDVAAYPERVTELLERWCGGKWAKYIVVTLKFQDKSGDSKSSVIQLNEMRPRKRTRRGADPRRNTYMKEDLDGFTRPKWESGGSIISSKDWAALDAAITVASKHHYRHRSKHFFNNKNECTLMLKYHSNYDALTSTKELHNEKSRA